MNLRALPESKFLLKYLFISLGLLGFAALSAYDGFVRYPAKIPRLEAWERLKSEVEQSPSASKEVLISKWEKFADEQGFSSRVPDEDESSADVRTDIRYQYLMIAIGVLVGLPMLGKYFSDKESWVESTEESLKGSWGQEMQIAWIEKFDKEKWDKKGIGVFHYKNAKGIPRKFVVDDLKYNRDTIDRIVLWVESRIPREMIVGGAPEPIPDGDEESESQAD